MAKRPTLTVTAAVTAFEVERRTLQRMLAADQLPGSVKDGRGRWTIPVEALHVAGFTARKTWIADATEHDNDATSDATRRDTNATPTRQTASNQRKASTTSDATERDNDATDLRQHVARLEAQLETEKQLREAAERNAEDLRTAMRMIEAGRPQSSAQESATPPSRRRWWQRA